MIEFYNSSDDMARALVSYIPCDKRVQSEIAASYGTIRYAPSLANIRIIRKRYERERDREPAMYDASVVWMDERYQSDMEAANDMFVKRLFRESGRYG